jgi:copper chaperone CopZ
MKLTRLLIAIAALTFFNLPAHAESTAPLTETQTEVTETKESGKTIYADVNGLVCDFCARALEKVFSREELVDNILVDLDTKVITIAFKGEETLTDEQITSLITDAGYNVEAIRRND